MPWKEIEIPAEANPSVLAGRQIRVQGKEVPSDEYKDWYCAGTPFLVAMVALGCIKVEIFEYEPEREVMAENVIESTSFGYAWDEEYLALMDAIDLASDQHQMTWITYAGKRRAAIVPVETVETAEQMNPLAVNPVTETIEFSG